MKKNFNINGKVQQIEFSPKDTLLDLLRNNDYTEVKDGCREGSCGTCTVLLDGNPVNSCMVFAASVGEKVVTTVKGIGTNLEPHPIQKAFAEAGAVQCGYCTPGMVLSTYALLSKNNNPTEEDIKTALDGNLCRCTGYVKIIDAVKLAAEKMRNNLK
ncbi:MAG: (2Fe-2S)-binding protein [Candidatus Cloacimonetes bacterium]|nr:(2Fe-2S)-binding protein [Candidatus Cloacimonadota bacterium]